MEWLKRYEIGIKQMDDQHKKLVGMISQLQDSLPRGIVNREIGNVMKALVDYARHHFVEEEAMMAQIGYGGLDEHRQFHKKLIGEVTQILLDIKAGKEITALDLIEFLKHWLVDHILSEDVKYAEPYAEKMRAAMAGVHGAVDEAAGVEQANEPLAGEGGSEGEGEKGTAN